MELIVLDTSLKMLSVLDSGFFCAEGTAPNDLQREKPWKCCYRRTEDQY